MTKAAVLTQGAVRTELRQRRWQKGRPSRPEQPYRLDVPPELLSRLTDPCAEAVQVKDDLCPSTFTSRDGVHVHQQDKSPHESAVQHQGGKRTGCALVFYSSPWPRAWVDNWLYDI